MLQSAQFSTFAGNYNCKTGTLKEPNNTSEMMQPLMNFKRGTDVYTGQRSGFNSNYENKPY